MGILRASLDLTHNAIVGSNTTASHDVNTFSATTEEPFQTAGKGHLKELAWLIPLAIVGTMTMIFLALLLYYGVTALERKMADCCFRTFGCCRPEASRIGEESESLSRTYALQETKGYRSTTAYEFNLN